jgi:hypothetical protein
MLTRLNLLLAELGKPFAVDSQIKPGKFLTLK